MKIKSKPSGIKSRLTQLKTIHDAYTAIQVGQVLSYPFEEGAIAECFLIGDVCCIYVYSNDDPPSEFVMGLHEVGWVNACHLGYLLEAFGVGLVTVAPTTRVLSERLPVPCDWAESLSLKQCRDGVESGESVSIMLLDNSSFKIVMDVSGLKYRLIVDPPSEFKEMGSMEFTYPRTDDGWKALLSKCRLTQDALRNAVFRDVDLLELFDVGSCLKYLVAGKCISFAIPEWACVEVYRAGDECKVDYYEDEDTLAETITHGPFNWDDLEGIRTELLQLLSSPEVNLPSAFDYDRVLMRHYAYQSSPIECAPVLDAKSLILVSYFENSFEICLDDL